MVMALLTAVLTAGMFASRRRSARCGAGIECARILGESPAQRLNAGHVDAILAIYDDEIGRSIDAITHDGYSPAAGARGLREMKRIVRW
jgi:hypothetical protein